MICVKCQVEMRVKRNGVLAISYDANGDPVMARYGDLFACPECVSEVLTGLAHEPVAVREGCEKVAAEELRFSVVVNYWLNPSEKARSRAATNKRVEVTNGN